MSQATDLMSKLDHALARAAGAADRLEAAERKLESLQKERNAYRDSCRQLGQELELAERDRDRWRGWYLQAEGERKDAVRGNGCCNPWGRRQCPYCASPETQEEIDVGPDGKLHRYSVIDTKKPR